MPNSNTPALLTSARFVGVGRLLALVLIAFLGTPSWAAEAKRNFNVGEGDAATTLKQLAKQAGQQVVFPAQDVKGVTTPAIRGEYSLKEALDLALANTGLEAKFDTTTGTFAVSRTELPNVQRAVQMAKSDRPNDSLAFAQPVPVQAKFGVIAGRVFDAETKANLAGAEVSVTGTAIISAVESDGSYQLRDVPAGAHGLTASYVGYTPRESSVTVRAGETVTHDLGLKPEVVHLAAFHVEGAREGQARAINQQKSAYNIKNIISADAIGNFPDQNAADALQRVTGIAVTRVRGEAENVSIRGAAPNFNSITLDGVSQGANNYDGRTVKLIDYPSEMLAGIEVTKSVTPDMDGDSVGGHIALKSKSAFDTAGRVASLNVNALYSDQTRLWGYRSGLTFTDRFGKNEDWGLAISGFSSRRKGVEENIDLSSAAVVTSTASGQSFTAIVPPTIQLNNEDYDRTKLNGSIRLEKRFGADTRVHVSVNDGRYVEKTKRPSDFIRIGTSLDATKPIVVDNGHLVEFTTTNGGMDKNVNPRTFTDTTRNIAFGGSTVLADWKISADGGYNQGTLDQNNNNGRIRSVGSTSITVNLRNYVYPTFTFNSGTDLTNPANYAFFQAQIRDRFIRSREYSGNVDAERPFDLAEGRLVFKAGIKARESHRNYNDTFLRYDALAPGTTFSATDPRFYSGTTESNGSFLGRYSLGFTIDPTMWQAFLPQNLTLFTQNLGVTTQNSISNDYDSNETITAGYLMGTWTKGRWTVVAGFREEHTEEASKGFAQNPALATTNLARYTRKTFSSTYNNPLPSVHLRYEAAKNLIFRASWNNTFARPEVNKLAPTQTVNTPVTPSVTDPVLVSGGNPALRAMKSQNVDVGGEYYFSNIGIASVGYFHKQLDGPVYTGVFDGTYQGQPARYTAFANAGKASLDGWEFTWQQNLTMLPTPFDGFGLLANLTAVRSHVDIPTRPGESFPLFNQSNYIANGAITYQKHGAFVRLAWNYTGPYLNSLGSQHALDDFKREYRVIDLLANYKISQRWKISIEANNLTNEQNSDYNGSGRYGVVTARIGRAFACGATFNY